MQKLCSERVTAQKDPRVRTQRNSVFQLPLDNHTHVEVCRNRNDEVNTLVQESAWRRRLSRVDETLSDGPPDIASLPCAAGVEEDVGRAWLLVGYVSAELRARYRAAWTELVPLYRAGVWKALPPLELELSREGRAVVGIITKRSAGKNQQSR